MTISIATGAAAYANAARSLVAPAAGAVKGNGTGFADILKSAFQGAIDAQKQGEAASLSAVTGKADINGVVTAVNNAELTLQTVLAVRDKVVAAYQEILHMPV
jgi:flagellar hook-basal body complex protein FliE